MSMGMGRAYQTHGLQGISCFVYRSPNRLLIMSNYLALQVDPPTCPISAAGGTSKHKLINNSDKKLAFKVRTTNNGNYSVSIVTGFVKMGETVDFTITRVKGKPKADKLVFQFADVPDDCSNPAEPFKGDEIKGEVTGTTVMKLSAAE